MGELCLHNLYCPPGSHDTTLTQNLKPVTTEPLPSQPMYFMNWGEPDKHHPFSCQSLPAYGKSEKHAEIYVFSPFSVPQSCK